MQKQSFWIVQEAAGSINSLHNLVSYNKYAKKKKKLPFTFQTARKNMPNRINQKQWGLNSKQAWNFLYSIAVSLQLQKMYLPTIRPVKKNNQSQFILTYTIFIILIVSESLCKNPNELYQ